MLFKQSVLMYTVTVCWHAIYHKFYCTYSHMCIAMCISMCTELCISMWTAMFMKLCSSTLNAFQYAGLQFLFFFSIQGCYIWAGVHHSRQFRLPFIVRFNVKWSVLFIMHLTQNTILFISMGLIRKLGKIYGLLISRKFIGWTTI